MKANDFDFSADDRHRTWQFVIEKLEHFYQNTEELSVAPKLNIDEIKSFISSHDFEHPLDAEFAIGQVYTGLSQYAVHTPHPSYYGLFNPRPVFPGIIADLMTAVFNPQMAAWSHAPFATEVENYCIKSLGEKFGYRESDIDGTFCSGGAEANLTAVLCALNFHFPQYSSQGLKGLEDSPVMYCSKEAHHSVVRAARVVGLGLKAVRSISTDDQFRMDTRALKETIEEDVRKGFKPFLVVANGGSTGTGAIDPLDEIGNICQHYNLWYHVDAAYGGAIVIDPKTKGLLNGIENSDSITMDIHKWFSVPMGTGMMITRHPDILSQTFRITADYMPKDAKEMEVVDPYTHSIQWSRRFIGLKFYMTLLMLGWEGLIQMVSSTTTIGNKLGAMLEENGWEIANDTPLPIVCFTDPKHRNDPEFIHSICRQIVSSGKAWISIYNINDQPTLRACITNYATGEEELKNLISLLGQLRLAYRNS